jgi:hypothetical protein
MDDGIKYFYQILAPLIFYNHRSVLSETFRLYKVKMDILNDIKINHVFENDNQTLFTV